jgi:4-amino-4-deoxy-L-arabinose transferase-like glycosyltransferase
VERLERGASDLATLTRIAAFAVLLAGSYAFVGLGCFGLANNNEGLYGSVARDMLARGDFVVPHANGVEYLEKPPLLYWCTAGAFAIFGYTEFAARSTSALAYLGVVVGLLWFGGRTKRPEEGVVAALIFGSCLGQVILSRILLFDPLLTALLAGALLSLYSSLDTGSGRWLPVSYAFLAFAAMTKGLVAVVLYAGIAIGARFLCTPGAGPPKPARMFSWPALFLAAAIAVPWHVLAAARSKEFLGFYFVNEHVLRFLGLREPHDYYHGPILYYLPRILVYCAPWCLFVPWLLARGPEDPESRRWDRFLWLWLLVPLLFFSLSSGKANYYMMVSTPALALLLARRLIWLRQGLLSAWLTWIPAAPVAFAIVAWPWLGPRLDEAVAGWSVDLVQFHLTLLASGSLVAAGVVAIIGTRGMAGAIAMSLAGVPLLVFALNAIPDNESRISARQLARFIEAREAGREVLQFKGFEDLSALSFYLGRPVRLIETASSDLQMGLRHDPRGALDLSEAEFESICRAKRVCVVVSHHWRSTFEPLARSNGLECIQEIGSVAVYVN